MSTSTHMDVEAMSQLLETAWRVGIDKVVATTPHGSYTFGITGADLSRSRGVATLRLDPIPAVETSDSLASAVAANAERRAARQ